MPHRTMNDGLLTRSAGRCELCGRDQALSTYPVPPMVTSIDRVLVVCGVCHPQLEQTVPLDKGHWFCLNEAFWSETPVVQVVSWRLLGRLRSEPWARDLLEQRDLDEDVLAWAKADGVSNDEAAAAPTLDSNGNPLAEGDSVTIIKDLDVKGAALTAKRGTLVKNIHLTGDPAFVEGRVNGVAIVLKTQFLKRA
jgi:protein PhnA